MINTPSPLKIFRTELLLLVLLSRFKKYLLLLFPFSYQVALSQVFIYIIIFNLEVFKLFKVFIRRAFATLFLASFDLRDSFSLIFTSFFFAIFYGKLPNSVFN